MNHPTHTRGIIPGRPVGYPVDDELLKQKKCRTQALKGLLSIPPESPKAAKASFSLAYWFGALRSLLQVKL